MKRTIPIFLILASSLLGFTSAARNTRNEYTFSLKNSLNLNKPDFTSNTIYTNCKNTFSQGLEFNYTRRLGRHLLLFAGIEGGNDKYKFTLNAPFNVTNKTQAAVTTGSPGNIDATIPFARVSLGVGYRFKTYKGFTPEIRLAQVMQMAFKYQDAYSEQYVYPSQYYYGRYGYFGNGHDGERAAELINTLYLGVRYATGSARLKSINAGIQLQRKFIMLDEHSGFNYLRMTYTDNTGAYIGQDIFSGRHTSVSLIVGVTF